MEAIATYAAWVSGFVSNIAEQVQPLLRAGVKTVAPLANPAPVLPAAVPMAPPSSVSLGLKLLLDPTAGGIICRVASNTVATIYPVYASAKAIESKDHQDDVQWLTYWTLYGSVILAENIVDKVLGRVPYYYHVKLAALLWLQLPQTRGAAYLYNRYYKPALTKYGPRVDAVLDKLQALLASVYAANKLYIDGVISAGAEAYRRLAAAVAQLISKQPAARGSKERGGAKANAA